MGVVDGFSLDERAKLGAAPVSEAAPAGADVRSAPEFEAIEAEVRKLDTLGPNAVDWPMVTEGSLDIIANKSKDFLVGAWCAYGLFRGEGLAGLWVGLSILHGIIVTHWEGAAPPVRRERARVAALDWLFGRLGPMIEAIKVGDAPAPLVVAVDTAVRDIDAAMSQRLQKETLSVGDFFRALRPHIEEIKRAEAEAKRLEAEAKRKAEADAKARLAEEQARAAAKVREEAEARAREAAAEKERQEAELRAKAEAEAAAARAAAEAEAAAARAAAEAEAAAARAAAEAEAAAAAAKAAAAATPEPQRQPVATSQPTAAPAHADVSLADGRPSADGATASLIGAPASSSATPPRDAMQEAVVQAHALSENGKAFDALEILSQTLRLAPTGRQRAHWQLAQARFCVDNGFVVAALPLVEHLEQTVNERALESWEPDLAAAVAELRLRVLMHPDSQPLLGEERRRTALEESRNRLARLDIAAAARLLRP
jgi:type VI secretion system protein VasJ